MTSNSEKASKIRGRAKFVDSRAFIKKNFKKLRISIFFEKKLYLKKENLEAIQNHFLLHPTPQMKKLSKNYFSKNMF